MSDESRCWALFRNGVQISKAHPHRVTAKAEAYERGAYVSLGIWHVLIEGYEIREVRDE